MKLNLGCGNKAKYGFIGVDKYPCDAVEVIADICEELPFEASTVEEIFMDNVIEHILDIPALFEELHRICKPKAKITLFTPHFASHASWRDPTHIHHLSYFSMNHFEKKASPIILKVDFVSLKEDSLLVVLWAISVGLFL